jgi:hypothetical protein
VSEPVLVAEADAGAAVVPVADGLLRELMAFGRMATTYDQLFGDVAGYCVRRARPSWSLIAALEEIAGLRLSAPMAHSYAVGHWPSGVPIGGYAAPGAAPAPSDVIRALVDHWDAAASGYSTYLRLLRSALWVINAHDFAAGIRYLVDLHEAGGAPQEDSLRRVVVELILARARVDSDAETVSFLLGSAPPESPDEWLTTLSSLPDIGVPYETQRLPPPCRRALQLVLERTVSEVQRVREAESYDAWFEGRLHSRGAISILLHLFGHGLYPDNRRPPAVEGVLSQLEEIQMDGEALRGMPLLDGGMVAYQPPPQYAEDLHWARSEVASGYREAFGELWAERLFRERLLVPEAVGPSVLTSDAPLLPQEWRGLSWRLGHPFAALFRPGVGAPLIRTERFEPETIASVGSVDAFFDECGVRGVAQRIELIQREYAGVGAGVAVPRVDMDELRGVVRAAHFALAASEIAEILLVGSAFAQAGDQLRALAHLEHCVDLYPFNDSIRFGCALVRSQLDDWGSARDHMVAALTLAPSIPERWQHLELVLVALGRLDEARIASQVGAIWNAQG